MTVLFHISKNVIVYKITLILATNCRVLVYDELDGLFWNNKTK